MILNEIKYEWELQTHALVPLVSLVLKLYSPAIPGMPEQLRLNPIAMPLPLELSASTPETSPLAPKTQHLSYFAPGSFFSLSLSSFLSVGFSFLGSFA